MKAELQLIEKMNLKVNIGGFEVQMDASPPFGDAKHPSPKQLLLASMAGCTAMDVISLLKKYKQNFMGLKVNVEAEAVSTQPQIFHDALISFYIVGDVVPDKLNEAVHLSLSKFCSVNAMVSKVVPIRWKTFINEAEIGEGKAEFTI